MRRFFGIIGHPVRHSLSALMHTAAYQAAGVDAVYAALDVTPPKVGRVLSALRAMGMDGVNVTVPHKERVLRAIAMAGRIEETARRLGAVNTLALREGGWVGYNTDVVGFEQTLRDDLAFDSREKRVLVLGAGGASRAVVWVLARQEPARLVIANRTASKARALGRWIRAAAPGAAIEVAPYERRKLAALARESELLVNATSLGLRAGDPMPIAPEALHQRLAVCDLVYPAADRRASTTPLVAAARRRGALAVDGVPMLVYQGAESFRLWWDRPAPVAAMRQAVEQAVRQGGLRRAG